MEGAAFAFLLGSLATWSELRFSKYPHTGFLVAFKAPFLIYSAIYGAIAMAGFLLSGWLIDSKKLTIGGIDSASPYYPYCLALIMGLSAKAIMQLSFFTVGTGTGSFPIGFQTAVQWFDPYLTQAMSLKEFNAVRSFVKPHAEKHKDLNVVKAMIKQNIPDSIVRQQRLTFENELDKDQHVDLAMEHFLRFLGKETFTRVFPLRP